MQSALPVGVWKKRFFYRQKIEKQDKVMLMWYIYFTVDDLCEGAANDQGRAGEAGGDDIIAPGS